MDRNYTDFFSYPGNINEGTGVYEFPKLSYLDKYDKERVWQIFIRLIKDGDRQNEANFDLRIENQIVIKEEYFYLGSTLPLYTIAQIWTISGRPDGAMNRSAPTYIDDIKNSGKSDMRNQLQTALIEARQKYELTKKKKEKGTMNTSAQDNDDGNVYSKHNTMYFPLLASKFDNSKKYIRYPAYVQPKLDGTRCLIFLRKKNGGLSNVVAYTRQLNEYINEDENGPINKIKKELYSLLNQLYDTDKDQSIYFDGEIYNHNMAFEDIISQARTIKENSSHKDKNDNDNGNGNDNDNNNSISVEYCVYDCFYPLDINGDGFNHRHDQLEHIFNKWKGKVIKMVPTHIVNSIAEIQSYFEQYVKDKYEGIMIRNAEGLYQFSSGARSNDLIKMKNKETSEFEVVGFDTGSGKDQGTIKWQCQTSEGNLFLVKPKNVDYNELERLYRDCLKRFDKKYRGRLLTVEYEKLSKRGIPIRANSIGFRDID